MNLLSQCAGDHALNSQKFTFWNSQAAVTLDTLNPEIGAVWVNCNATTTMPLQNRCLGRPDDVPLIVEGLSRWRE